MSLTRLISNFNKIIRLDICSCETPIGNVVAAADNKYVYLVCFEDATKLESRLKFLSKELNCDFVLNENNKILQQFRKQLLKYFDGNLVNFTIPIKTYGSPFQQVSSIGLHSVR